MKHNSKFSHFFFTMVFVFIITGFSTWAGETQIAVTSPETFFGFRLGSDRQIARWDKIVDYFELLQKESDILCIELQ